MSECPMCGAAVTVVTGGEGTSHYQPIDSDNDGLQDLGRAALELAHQLLAFAVEMHNERVVLPRDRDG